VKSTPGYLGICLALFEVVVASIADTGDELLGEAEAVQALVKNGLVLPASRATRRSMLYRRRARKRSGASLFSYKSQTLSANQHFLPIQPRLDMRQRRWKRPG
jgi:hypothetical protein